MDQPTAEAIAAAIDADYTADITAAMEALELSITSANADTAHALQVVDRLCGPLYAVDYAEGPQGDDIAHHLREAMRSLRAAQAIHQSISR